MHLFDLWRINSILESKIIMANENFETREMVDYDGQAYQISRRGDVYWVVLKPNEKAGVFEKTRSMLKILKQYPNGYTIARSDNGTIFDFNENNINPIMGKLRFAFPINSSGAYVTLRKMNDKENSCALVSDGEDGLEPGERRPIDESMWHELMNEVNNRSSKESSLLYDDKAVAYEKNKVKFTSDAFKNIYKDQSLPNPVINGLKFYPDKNDQNKKVSIFPEVFNFDNDSTQGERFGQGYRIMRTFDDDLIFDNDNENGVIPITSYHQLLRDRMICSYKSKSGEDKNMYVSVSGKVAELSKEDAAAIIEHDNSYRKYMEQELKLADIRRDKAVAKIRPQFSREKTDQ